MILLAASCFALGLAFGQLVDHWLRRRAERRAANIAEDARVARWHWREWEKRQRR